MPRCMVATFVQWTEDIHPSIHPSIDLELSSRSESTAWLGGHAAAAKQGVGISTKQQDRCESTTRSLRETSIKVESELMNLWAVEIRVQRYSGRKLHESVSVTVLDLGRNL